MLVLYIGDYVNIIFQMTPIKQLYINHVSPSLEDQGNPEVIYFNKKK